MFFDLTLHAVDKQTFVQQYQTVMLAEILRFLSIIVQSKYNSFPANEVSFTQNNPLLTQIYLVIMKVIVNLDITIFMILTNAFFMTLTYLFNILEESCMVGGTEYTVTQRPRVALHARVHQVYEVQFQAQQTMDGFLFTNFTRLYRLYNNIFNKIRWTKIH